MCVYICKLFSLFALQNLFAHISLCQSGYVTLNVLLLTVTRHLSQPELGYQVQFVKNSLIHL